MSDYNPQSYPVQPAYPQPADPNYVAYLDQRVRTLEAKVTTGMLSGGFMKRAFTIWGYNFVAQLIISLVVGFIFFVLSLIFGATMFAAISEAIRQSGGSGF